MKRWPCVAPLVAVLIITTGIASNACRSSETRTVKIGWDVPAALPDGYRVFADDTPLLDTPPPPVDPSCGCLSLSVPVPYRARLLEVLAYNSRGVSPVSSVSLSAENDLEDFVNSANVIAQRLLDRLAARWHRAVRFISRHAHV